METIGGTYADQVSVSRSGKAVWLVTKDLAHPDETTMTVRLTPAEALQLSDLIRRLVA